MIFDRCSCTLVDCICNSNMKLVSQSKIHNLIVQLVVMIDVTQYVSILGCLHRFDYNAVLAMGLLYWFHLDKMLIQSVKMVIYGICRQGY
jgi:hypothetical protein